MRNLKQVLLALIMMCCSISSAIAGGYEYEDLYRGLPFDMPRIEKPVFPDATVSVVKYGAVGDGQHKCTAAIQRAIDEMAAKGGGKVIIPSGLWLTGPIVLKDNINLHLEKGATLLFSPDINDYPIVNTTYEGIPAKRAQSPISATGVKNIAITGRGVIDGNGEVWRPLKQEKTTPAQWKRITSQGGFYRRATMWAPAKEDLPRPIMVNLYECKNVLLEGVVFQNSPAWNVHPECCENVIIDGVDIRNPSYAQNGDGLDLDACKNCIVVNTTFDVGDDGICIKSGKDEHGRKRGRACENVIISGCTVYAGHGGFVIGSEMSGGVKNIKCSDCQFLGTDIGLRFKSCRGRGGVVENIWIEDISMVNILGDAIRFNLYYGAKTVMVDNPDGTKRPAEIAAEPVTEKTPSFRNLHIKNIMCSGAQRAIYFNGLPEMPVKDVTMENVVITANEAGYMTYCKNIKQKNVTVKAKDNKPVGEYYCK